MLWLPRSDRARYRLGILLDGNGGGAIGDPYVFQPAILRSFGWKLIDIPAHSWLRDPGAVIAQIEAALRQAPFDGDDDPFEGSAMPPPVASVAASGSEPKRNPKRNRNPRHLDFPCLTA